MKTYTKEEVNQICKKNCWTVILCENEKDDNFIRCIII